MLLFRNIARIFAQHGNFTGRTSREEYWSFVLFYNFVMLIVSTSLLALPFQWVACVIALISIPLAAAAVRRLHDVGHSGYWLLLCLMPAISGYFMISYQNENAFVTLLSAFTCIVSAIACYLPLRWLNSQGQTMRNRFGDVPDAHLYDESNIFLSR